MADDYNVQFIPVRDEIIAICKRLKIQYELLIEYIALPEYNIIIDIPRSKWAYRNGSSWEDIDNIEHFITNLMNKE